MMNINTNNQMMMIEDQKALLEQAKAEGNPNKVCEILGKLARTLVDVGQAEAALLYLDDAITTAEKHNLIEVKASNLGNRGVALVRLKQFDKAREQFDQVEAIAEEINEPALRCDALMQKSIMHFELQRGDLIQSDLLKALEIAEGIGNTGDTKRQMRIHALLGHNHFNIASFDEAAKYFLKALELAEKMDNRMAQAGYHHNLGNVYYSADVPGEAVIHLTKAVEIFRELGDQQGEINALLRLVKSFADSDQPEKTYEAAREGFALAKIVGDKKSSNSFSNLLIVTSKHLGLLNDTLELIQQAMEEAVADDDSERKLNLFVSLGNTYYELDKYENAKETYFEGLNISVRLQNWELKTRILGRLSAVEADLGDLEKSIEYSKEALEVAEKIGNHRLIGEQYMMLAFGARDQGDLEAAKTFVEKARGKFTIIEDQAALEKLDQFIAELQE